MLAKPHQTGANGGDGVVVCIRKRPPLATLNEVAAAAPATAPAADTDAAAGAGEDAAAAASASADGAGDGGGDGGDGRHPQAGPEHASPLQLLTHKGYEDCDVITALNPVVFVHQPEERLGVPTGRLHSIGHTYDHTFGNRDDNSAVYTAVVQPLVQLTAKEGGTGTILAFGQTGSGKTYTQSYMQERACAELFATRPPGTSIFVSFFENCGDAVFDLLNAREALQIRTGVIEGEVEERVHVRGLTEVRAESAAAALRSIRAGSTLRSSAPTQRNPDSSRSHAICILTLRRDADSSFAGLLRVVDLAGSERREDVYEHSMERIKEMQQINWSLGCLKECIRGLFLRETSEPTHMIKFRNSKLTLLLRDVFLPGVQQRTAFIACVAPLSRDWKHTRSTLGYTSKLKLIDDVHTGRAATPVELADGLLNFYQQKGSKFTRAKVREILAKNVGKEALLYRKLTAKYRDAPTVLLLAPKPVEAKSTKAIKVDEPAKWSRKKVKAFVKKVAGEQYADRFNMTGSQMLMLDIKGMQRRCGGRWSCAAFSDKLAEDDDALTAEKLAAEAEAAEAAEVAGKALWDAWLAKVRAAKAAGSRLRGAGSGYLNKMRGDAAAAGAGAGGGGGGAAAALAESTPVPARPAFDATYDVPVDITILSPDKGPGFLNSVNALTNSTATTATAADGDAAAAAVGDASASASDPAPPAVHPVQYLE